MLELYTILKDIGNLSLDAVWFPLLVWSVCALAVYVLLKIFDNSDVLYQYHSRVALIAGVPLGIFVSLTATYIAGLFSTSSPGQLSFIIIQNPITVTADTDAASAAINWSDPYLWLGLVTALLAIVAFVQIVRLTWSYLQISQFARSLIVTGLDTFDNLSPRTKNLYGELGSKTSVAFSGEIEIPFTFGWRKPVIVIPSSLRQDADKVDLAVRHELMHIKRSDYLLNGIIMAVKSLFWFHPLLHLFHREIREYREISCDSEVLADETVSRKKYAQLLFELSQKHEFTGSPVVSMSVNNSTLKKRINTMKTLTPKRPTIKSILVSIVLLTGISGFIACSDLQTSGGVTNSELKQAQTQIRNSSSGDQPLYVIREDTDLDGAIDHEEIMSKADNAKLANIKPKYIRAIEVLKGEQATQQYGPKGANGVIIITLLDQEKALNDLKPPPAPTNKTEEDFFVVVEEMPKLIGGLESVQQKIEYPEMARKAGIEGRVIVQFIVNEQGQVENPQIIRGIGGGCDQEALRVVSEAQFEPGKQRGRPVRVQYSLPIVYKLPGSSSVTREESSVYMENPKMEGKQFVYKNIHNREAGTITGTILDAETQEPMPGVNVVIASTSTGTATDTNGEFELANAPIGSQKLIFSYVGYQTETLIVNVN